ncbi:MAG: DUF2029 domain-containing protein [Phycisphaera sp.]|nr:DUF2029 domain-containing protein [Phycisphaera sp.]
MPTATRRWSWTDRGSIVNTWVGWVIVALVMAILAGLNPHQRTVTNSYRDAAERWWAGQPIYEDTQTTFGFLYLPQSALVYSPFIVGPAGLSEAVYRVVITGLYAMALWRLCGWVWPTRGGGLFPLASLLVLPLAIGALRNGQANVPLFALMALAAVDAHDGKYVRCAALLALALAVKPLAVVMILLVVAIHPRKMALPMLAALLVVFLLPFVFQPWHASGGGYAWSQYTAAYEKLRSAASPVEPYQDLRGMLMAWGVDVPEKVLTMVRAVAAMGTLALAYVAQRRWPARQAGFALLALALGYLMVFNPRTEGTSYVMWQPVIAVFAGLAFFVDRRPWLGVALVVLSLANNFAYDIVPPPKQWFRPLACLVVLAVLTWVILYRPPWGESFGQDIGEAGLNPS